MVVGGGLYAWAAKDLPEPGTAPKGRDQTTVLLDRNGEELAKLFAEQNRTDKKLEEIPIALRQAVIATEDERFYEHAGVDPWSIGRALVTDVMKGEVKQGGSTITQQYVKNAFVTPERTLKRKIMEALLAYRLEKDFEKDEILQLYLNTIYFGHGAYGIESAAQVYFGNHVGDVTLAECAMLAGVIKSPGRFSPYLDPVAAKERRSVVLRQMASQGYITEEQRATADAEEFALVGLKPSSSGVAPYFVEYVKSQLTEEYGSEVVFRGGLRVQTTLDIRMQNAAEQAIAESLNQEGDPSAALVALDPKTGAILAMVGGRDFATQQYNVAAQGRRQPGSAFKPFVLATALATDVSPEQTFESGPRTFALPNGQKWEVTGASGGRKGPMRLREATEKSVNSVYAQLILDVKPSEVVQTANDMGISSEVEPVPAIALGGLQQGVSPLEMASAYGTLAAGGIRTEPFGIATVGDASGKELRSHVSTPTEAMDPEVAYLVTDILKGVISRGTGEAANIGRYAAGKTGTTQEYRDAWFVGYTPDLVCAVWVGYPESQVEMKNVHGRKVTGGSFPAEIWASFMKAALEGIDKKDFERPDGLVSVSICAETGLKGTKWCPTTLSPLFIQGSVPDVCDVHTGPAEVTIPNVVGMTKENALAALTQAMLRSSVVETDVANVDAGIVSSQNPAAGSVGTTETVVTIVVSNGGSGDPVPAADYTYTPAEPTADQAITFDASPSTDNGSIVTYLWEFGDGFQASGRQASHAFPDPGEWEVTLWVTDDAGQTASTTKVITVR